MAKSKRQRVAERACRRCEYCLLPQSCTSLPHELDHVRARPSVGALNPWFVPSVRNLALSNACLNELGSHATIAPNGNSFLNASFRSAVIMAQQPPPARRPGAGAVRGPVRALL